VCPHTKSVVCALLNQKSGGIMKEDCEGIENKGDTGQKRWRKCKMKTIGERNQKMDVLTHLD